MKIEPKNQHDTNTAEVEVTVGNGLDGDEANEPYFNYIINADGLTLSSNTDEDVTVGRVELGVQDLNAICGAPSDEPSETLTAIATHVIGCATRVTVFVGAKAVEEFRRHLAEVWGGGAVGKVWGFSKDAFVWTELAEGDNKAVNNSEVVTIDATRGDLSWKFTYHGQFDFGTFVCNN